MKGIIIFAIVIIQFHLTCEIWAQQKSNSIGINLGIIQNYTPRFDSQTLISPYVELNYSGKFFTSGVDWVAVAGYWNDFIDEDLKISDHDTKNYSSIIFGLRLKAKFGEIFKSWKTSPVNFEIGISEHFVNAYEVNNLFSPTKIPDKNFNMLHFEVGLSLDIFLSQSIALIPKIIIAISPQENNIVGRSGKAPITLGVAYHY